MKQFQTEMNAKAHLRKIKNAKTTMDTRKPRQGPQRISEPQDVTLLRLYEANQMSSIPIYKLLKSMGLQQYTKELIIRGYGVNIGKLAFLSDLQREKLYDEIKVMPGHSTKLNKIIEIVTNSNKSLTNISSCSGGPLTDTNSIFKRKTQDHFINELNERDEYDTQLERILNQYTPKISSGAFNKDEKLRNIQESSKDLPKETLRQTQISQIKDKSKVSMTKNNGKYPMSNKIESLKNIQQNSKRGSIVNEKFQKKSIATRSSAKDISTAASRAAAKKQTTKSVTNKSQMPSLKSLDKLKDRPELLVQLRIDRVKALFMSVDGAIMTSTILNIDLEEQCYCLAAYLQKKITPADRKKSINQNNQNNASHQDQDINEEEVGNILRQSYLHPLFKNEIEPLQEHQKEENVEIAEEIDREPQSQFIQLEEKANALQESSLLGNQSVSFGLINSLEIFQEPYPTEVDYYIPTVDSLANFVKNIVLSAKMERQVPILSVLYLEKFLGKTKLNLTSTNYKRLLIACLLLASKIWDDESFETPSFSHTFPDYPTVLLNELQKQILVTIDYELKLNRKQYALLYYKLRQLRQPTGKSYQNRALNIMRVRDLQKGSKKLYKSDFLVKRKSF